MNGLDTSPRKSNRTGSAKTIPIIFLLILLTFSLAGPDSWAKAEAAVTSQNVNLVTHYQGGAVYNIFDIKGGKAYIDANINGQSGLHVFDLFTQQSTAFYAFDYQTSIVAVLVDGTMAYVLLSRPSAFGADYLQSINLTTKQYVGRFYHPDGQFGQVGSLEKKDQHILIGSWNPAGVYTVNTDVLEEGRYTSFSHFPTARNPADLALVDNTLYVSFNEYPIGGMYILNGADPLHLSEIGRFEINEAVDEVGVSPGRDIVYLQGSSQLQIIEVSDPQSPKALNTIPCSSFGKFAISGNTLYLKGPIEINNRLEVWDTSFPEAPLRVGGYSDPEWTPRHLFAVGNTIYAAAGSAGLVTLEFVPPQLLIEANGSGWYRNGTALAVGTKTQLLPGDTLLHRCSSVGKDNPVRIGDIDPCKKSEITAHSKCDKTAEVLLFYLMLLKNEIVVSLNEEDALQTAKEAVQKMSNGEFNLFLALIVLACTGSSDLNLVPLAASGQNTIGLKMQSGIKGFSISQSDLTLYVSTETATATSLGTNHFAIGHLPDENKSLIVADGGSLTVTPENPVLPPFTLPAGKLALVTSEAVEIKTWRPGIFLPLIIK